MSAGCLAVDQMLGTAFLVIIILAVTDGKNMKVQKGFFCDHISLTGIYLLSPNQQASTRFYQAGFVLLNCSLDVTRLTPPWSPFSLDLDLLRYI